MHTLKRKADSVLERGVVGECVRARPFSCLNLIVLLYGMLDSSHTVATSILNVKNLNCSRPAKSISTLHILLMDRDALTLFRRLLY